LNEIQDRTDRRLFIISVSAMDNDFAMHHNEGAAEKDEQ
jgi:hypothetical protein